MTISRRKKLIKEILDSLKSPATLSTGCGRVLIGTCIKPNRKSRRHDGRRYARVKYPPGVLEENFIESECYWDDWKDYRDGFRNGLSDFSRKPIHPRCCRRDEDKSKAIHYRRKLLKQYKIRKLRKALYSQAIA